MCLEDNTDEPSVVCPDQLILLEELHVVPGEGFEIVLCLTHELTQESILERVVKTLRASCKKDGPLWTRMIYFVRVKFD